MEQQILDDTIVEFEIGPGDDVFMVGLFSRGAGGAHDIPIVRTGSIAAMPSRPIYLPKRHAELRAYLIEARSSGGLSGSPVFVHLGHLRQRAGTEKVAFAGVPVFWLGMIHGHYEYQTDKVNLGMAVVIPNRIVSDVVNCPREQQFRRATNLERRGGPIPDRRA